MITVLYGTAPEFVRVFLKLQNVSNHVLRDLTGYSPDRGIRGTQWTTCTCSTGLDGASPDYHRTEASDYMYIDLDRAFFNWIEENTVGLN